MARRLGVELVRCLRRVFFRLEVVGIGYDKDGRPAIKAEDCVCEVERFPRRGVAAGT